MCFDTVGATNVVPKGRPDIPRPTNTLRIARSSQNSLSETRITRLHRHTKLLWKNHENLDFQDFHENRYPKISGDPLFRIQI